MHSCPTCHIPLDPEKKAPYCSLGCALYLGFKTKKNILFVRLGIGLLSLLWFLLIPVINKISGLQSPPLLLSLIIGAVLAATLTVPVLIHTFRLIGLGRWLDSDLLFLLPVLIDTCFSVVLLVKNLLGHSFFDYYPPFQATGLVLLLIYAFALLECQARIRACQDVRKIIALKPEQARVLIKNQESFIAVDNLKVGDVIRVLPGETIPCDGIISSGTTSVDESLLTNEKSIFLKTRGQQVTGASLNRDGLIHIEIMDPPSEHFLSKLMESFYKGMGSPDSVFPSWMKPLYAGSFAVLLTAALAGLIHNLAGASNPVSLTMVIHVLLIVSLVNLIRILPLIEVMTMGKTLTHGILLDSFNLVKKLAGVDILFFDKTGTITQGTFAYSQVFLERGVNQGTFLSTIFSLEALSDHPIAQGMQTHPWYREMTLHPVKDFAYHKGLGICGKVCERGKPERFAAIGNLRFLKRFQMQVSRALRERIDELESIGETALLCGWDGQIKGIIAMADTLRSDVKPLLDGLLALQIDPVLITSDHNEMISHLHVTHGLKDMYSRCLPDEKISKINKRKEKGHIVGMVGSPLDDPDIIHQSDVGIVIGTGTRLPQTKKGVVIFGQSLLKLTHLVHYCRNLNKVSKALLRTSLFYLLGLSSTAVVLKTHFLWILVALAPVIIVWETFPLWINKKNLSS